jgi:hypothetical protein
MSLKRNILASYASQIYVTLVGILVLPLYLKYMGAEAYGLVGFFTAHGVGEENDRNRPQNSHVSGLRNQ